MEKLQLCALIPFMLSIPYPTLFVQENTSNDQILSKFRRNSPLARISPLAKLFQGVYVDSEVLAKSLKQN